jgi:hypothetical protein
MGIYTLNLYKFMHFAIFAARIVLGEE